MPVWFVKSLVGSFVEFQPSVSLCPQTILAFVYRRQCFEFLIDKRIGLWLMPGVRTGGVFVQVVPPIADLMLVCFDAEP